VGLLSSHRIWDLYIYIGAISSTGLSDLDIIIILQEFSNLIAYFLGNICVSWHCVCSGLLHNNVNNRSTLRPGTLEQLIQTNFSHLDYFIEYMKSSFPVFLLLAYLNLLKIKITLELRGVYIFQGLPGWIISETLKKQLSWTKPYKNYYLLELFPLRLV